ncbi:hypothetical protein AYL99_09540 [Fonsecaea erecta]|uniref:Uncharacterized protein n=1 Tax=Fonsecaea erecta TaxID=1367422 RepID=A0A178ZA65_9EURO|nr:hypothetical protein AYL99_09540 [Fonsecaea erecta]OAP56361.1 hypothetical protein AYL99_09540 [Fonsecaea erecta]
MAQAEGTHRSGKIFNDRVIALIRFTLLGLCGTDPILLTHINFTQSYTLDKRRMLAEEAKAIDETNPNYTSTDDPNSRL